MDHLAQANISLFSAQLNDLIMKAFVNFLEPVNKRKEESPGLLWRLIDGEWRSASYIESPFKDEMIAINIGVLEGIEFFKNFVYGTVHSYFLKNQKKWLDLSKPSHFIICGYQQATYPPWS